MNFLTDPVRDATVIEGDCKCCLVVAQSRTNLKQVCPGGIVSESGASSRHHEASAKVFSVRRAEAKTKTACKSRHCPSSEEEKCAFVETSKVTSCRPYSAATDHGNETWLIPPTPPSGY